MIIVALGLLALLFWLPLDFPKALLLQERLFFGRVIKLPYGRRASVDGVAVRFHVGGVMPSRCWTKKSKRL
jgi:hypothetical protein